MSPEPEPLDATFADVAAVCSTAASQYRVIAVTARLMTMVFVLGPVEKSTVP